MTKALHRISRVDPQALTGLCQVCGVVKVSEKTKKVPLADGSTSLCSYYICHPHTLEVKKAWRKTQKGKRSGRSGSNGYLSNRRNRYRALAIAIRQLESVTTASMTPQVAHHYLDVIHRLKREQHHIRITHLDSANDGT